MGTLTTTDRLAAAAGLETLHNELTRTPGHYRGREVKATILATAIHAEHGSWYAVMWVLDRQDDAAELADLRYGDLHRQWLALGHTLEDTYRGAAFDFGVGAA